PLEMFLGQFAGFLRSAEVGNLSLQSGIGLLVRLDEAPRALTFAIGWLSLFRRLGLFTLSSGLAFTLQLGLSLGRFCRCGGGWLGGRARFFSRPFGEFFRARVRSLRV